MVCFGINGSVKRNKLEDSNKAIPRKSLPIGLQGFLFNSMNPFVYFFGSVQMQRFRLIKIIIILKL